jgi:hypothetical protein
LALWLLGAVEKSGAKHTRHSGESGETGGDPGGGGGGTEGDDGESGGGGGGDGEGGKKSGGKEMVLGDEDRAEATPGGGGRPTALASGGLGDCRTGEEAGKEEVDAPLACRWARRGRGGRPGTPYELALDSRLARAAEASSKLVLRRMPMLLLLVGALADVVVAAEPLESFNKLSSLLRCTELDDAPLLRAAEGPRVVFFFFLATSRRFSSPTEGAW